MMGCASSKEIESDTGSGPTSGTADSPVFDVSQTSAPDHVATLTPGGHEASLSRTLMEQRRQDVLSRVKAFRASSAKDDHGADAQKLEDDLANLHVTLPLVVVTLATWEAMKAAGRAIYLYVQNADLGVYIAAEDQDPNDIPKWLVLGSVSTEHLRFRAYLDSRANLVLEANINGKSMYLNWRDTTGCLKLYDDYDPLRAKDWEGDNTFKLFNPDADDGNGEYIGTRDPDSRDLYNRKTVYHQRFRFMMYDEDAFTADDKLIFRAFIKSQ